ncbi:MAG: ABC transporter permease [Nitrososphaerota archaeon]|uniref:ABC transporter permease n=1 Tax=Candidatus Bathycorpusculum sp. TaxID=2994959 RepID=UPI0028318B12|nr:ABC transporter permease [Candidatus Termiticorpusculum sp.]MCL2256782.1 ABC transporter permease [Candidatus Termiticorpusculum sp.]MCL2293152.1 ABC transporter permease [Candidatus Termiticorpusculum sp.]MDR0461033.1 ABC transporter permease [Nitrososphaerota archaeon]
MTELRGIYTLWLREVKRFIRDRVRVIISFVQPLLWLVVFAAGFSARIAIPGIDYQQFLFPGIIGQTLLFTAMFMGISVIWDKEFGFMKEILVAPVSRFSIFMGKMLGDSTAALLQGVIVFVFGFLIGIPFNPLTLLAALPLMLLITVGLVSIGLIIASFIGSLENFGAIQTFINLPLFFLSGALFPTTGDSIPGWMQFASKLDPLAYGVDALRTVILGPAWTPNNPLYVNLAIIAIFDLVMIGIGTWAFSRMKK